MYTFGIIINPKGFKLSDEVWMKILYFFVKMNNIWNENKRLYEII